VSQTEQTPDAGEEKPEESAKSGGLLRLRLLMRLRGYFLTGILVTTPVAITAAVAWWFVQLVDSRIVPLIPGHLNPDTYLREVVGVEIGLPGLGVIVLLLAITLIGAVTTGLVGRTLVRAGEAILQRMPVISSLYSGSKQILETVLQKQSNAFRQAVLVEYPRKGVWAFAFVTAATKGEIGRLLPGDHISLYVPTTPNPTSGFLLFVPREDVIPLQMPVEDAFKMMISMGIVTSPDLPRVVRAAASGKTAAPGEAP